MALWRISNHADLEGLGGERADGRWHSAARGKRIVYLSEHPALALVEAVANMRGNPRLFPDRYQLMRVTVPDDLVIPSVGTIAANWREDVRRTRAIGDAWLEGGESALFAVPSAVAPESVNYLLNPRQADAEKVAVEWSRWIAYDKRLFHLH